MNRLIITNSITIGIICLSYVGVKAFVQKIKNPQRTYHVNIFATKYVVIGGNIDGINQNEEEDAYNMSKKERRRREREKGAADFKSGKYKLKKKGTKINYDKLEDKVTRERTLLPREQREVTTNTRKKSRVEKKLSVKAARIKKQRTVGGMIDSSSESMSLSPEKQVIQIRTARRANKTVTMIQGLCVCFICVLYMLFRLGLCIWYH